MELVGRNVAEQVDNPLGGHSARFRILIGLSGFDNFRFTMPAI